MERLSERFVGAARRLSGLDEADSIVDGRDVEVSFW